MVVCARDAITDYWLLMIDSLASVNCEALLYDSLLIDITKLATLGERISECENQTRHLSTFLPPLSFFLSDAIFDNLVNIRTLHHVRCYLVKQTQDFTVLACERIVCDIYFTHLNLFFWQLGKVLVFLECLNNLIIWTPLLVLINPFCVELRIKLAVKIWTIIENSKFAVTQVSDTYAL